MNSVAKSGLNKAIEYLISDCDNSTLIDVTLSKLDAAQMLAVAIIRQAVRDVMYDPVYGPDAEDWLQSKECENILDLLGVNVSGKDILRMAMSKRNRIQNERSAPNESTNHLRQT